MRSGVGLSLALENSHYKEGKEFVRVTKRNSQKPVKLSLKELLYGEVRSMEA